MRFHCQLLSIWSAWSRRVGVGRWWPAATASRGDAVSPWCRWPSTVSPDPAGRGRPSLLAPAPHLNLVKNQTPIYEMNISSVGPSKSLMFHLNGSLTISIRWNWNVCILLETNKRLWPSVIAFQVIHFPFIVITVCHRARRPQDCYVDSVQCCVGSKHSVMYHSRFYN